MATSKRRLGRSLESLISGSVPASSPSPARSPASPKKSARNRKKPAAAASNPAPVRGGTTPGKQATAKKASTPSAAAEPAPSTPPSERADGLGWREIPIGKIVPNPHQPRKSFEPSHLAELAESIRSEGLLQPIVVRPVGDGFELIAGERRWRACQELKLRRIPARIIEATETSSAVMSLIENLQRENLNPIEEAQGYASLMADFGLTQEAVSERLGKARASIANSLRLLQLDRELQKFLAQRILSVGHAKVLLGLDSKDEQALVARQVIERQLSVRETEKLVQNRRKGGSVTAKTAGTAAHPAEQAALQDLEKRLTHSLNTRVLLKHSPRKGRILIEYFGNEDLQRILERMGITV